MRAIINPMDDHELTAIEIMTQIDTILGRRLASAGRGSDDHAMESVSQHIALLALARRVIGTFSADIEAELDRRADELNARIENAITSRTNVAAA